MKFTVETSQKTLLTFLKEHLPSYPSVKAIKRAIEAGQCKINGKVETFSTHPVKKGDQIEIILDLKRPIFVSKILSEDENLLVLNKAPGVASKELSEFFLVHRLDKQTSGVILFAKTLAMRNALDDLFRKRKIHKTYLALCDGFVKEKEWTVDNYLEKKASYQGGSLYGKAPKGKGKRAITHFTCKKTCPAASLVEARPITGRTHQIRIHLKGHGHPVLGDYQYEKKFICSMQPPRLMLHSWEIRFEHPFRHEIVSWKAPLFEDFLEMEKALFQSV